MSQTTDKPQERKTTPMGMLLELGERMDVARGAARESDAMTATIIESYRMGIKSLIADLNDARKRITELEAELHDLRPKEPDGEGTAEKDA